MLILSSQQQATTPSEGEEDDNWEWDAVTKQVRLLKGCKQTGAERYSESSEENAPTPADQNH